MIKTNQESYSSKNSQMSNLYNKSNKVVIVKDKLNQFTKSKKSGKLKHYQKHNCLLILVK